MLGEEERTQLIQELARLMRDKSMPEDARSAGLTLIGWLARRMPGEQASRDGVVEMRARAAALYGSSGANGLSANGRG